MVITRALHTPVWPCLCKVENASFRYTEYAVISTLPGIPVPSQQEN